MKIKLSKFQWKQIGKFAGWKSDPLANESDEAKQERLSLIIQTAINDYGWLRRAMQVDKVIIDNSNDFVRVNVIFKKAKSQERQLLEEKQFNKLIENGIQLILRNMKNVSGKKKAIIDMTIENQKNNKIEKINFEL